MHTHRPNKFIDIVSMGNLYALPLSAPHVYMYGVHAQRHAPNVCKSVWVCVSHIYSWNRTTLRMWCAWAWIVYFYMHVTMYSSIFLFGSDLIPLCSKKRFISAPSSPIIHRSWFPASVCVCRVTRFAAKWELVVDNDNSAYLLFTHTHSNTYIHLHI